MRHIKKSSNSISFWVPKKRLSWKVEFCVCKMTKKYHQLNQEQRYQIEALIKAGTSKTVIANIIGVDKSTVYREVKRNSVSMAKQPVYKAATAHNFACKRTYVPKLRAGADPAIIRRIRWLIVQHWSPEQIWGTCRRRGIEMLSVESIYLWIYAQKKKGVDYTKHLRRHHRKRRKRRLLKQPRTIIQNKVSIHDRPTIVAEQGRIGDFETDLVKCQNGYLVTITERKTLFNFIEKIPNKEAASVQKAIIKALQPYKEMVKTITSDNGTEFANHQKIAEDLQCNWFFADPYKSQQRGANENQNGLIRQFYTNKTDLNLIEEYQIKLVQNKLNARPRKKANFEKPNKLFPNHIVALGA